MKGAFNLMSIRWELWDALTWNRALACALDKHKIQIKVHTHTMLLLPKRSRDQKREEGSRRRRSNQTARFKLAAYYVHRRTIPIDRFSQGKKEKIINFEIVQRQSICLVIFLELIFPLTPIAHKAIVHKWSYYGYYNWNDAYRIRDATDFQLNLLVSFSLSFDPIQFNAASSTALVSIITINSIM